MSSDSPRPSREGTPGWLAGILLAIGGLLAARRAATGSEGEGIPASPVSVAAGHETSDMRVKQAVLALGLLIGAIFVLFLVVTGFETLMTGKIGNFQAPAGSVANQPNVPPPPAPRLETGNGQVLQELHAQEEPLLNSYSWIDQKSGSVRIPIDRAMDLILQRGLPVQQPANGQPNTGVLSRPAESSRGRTEEQIR